MIEVNTRVCHATDPSLVGWVVSIEGDSARVFINGSIVLTPISQLEPIPSLSYLSTKDFRIALTRARLELPLSEQFLSYRSSQTRLYYHQFLPVKKILDSPEQRLLIADEVGTGKTIEAGLIWAELEARTPGGLEAVWVVCPKGLVGKWQEEMLQRFDLRLEQLTPDGLRQALASIERDGSLPPRFAQAVTNIELLRQEENVARLGGSSATWDMVIFDEAHHLRNPDTLSHSVARLVAERSRAAVFLTATPLQTSLTDVVHLMEALGVDVAADPQLLYTQIEWDMQLNNLVKMLRHHPPGWEKEMPQLLTRLEATGGRARPGWEPFRELVESLGESEAKSTSKALQAARDLQILSPYMTRTMRGDVDANRPLRQAITRVVDYHPAEMQFYRAIYSVCLRRAQDQGAPPGFMTQMPERRTASCAPAVASEVLALADEIEDEEQQARFSREEIRALSDPARAVLESEDSKFNALLDILRHTFNDLEADRAMIFSTFKGTLRHLANRLSEEGYTLEIIHGNVPPKDEDCRKGEQSRERIAEDFRNGKFKVLLASEVAGEGLDFEHCHVLINYDLPWNPMRVEQRIGRCDRLGQKSEKVYIGSLTSRGTIEERILTRLYLRLNIFEQALGDMELILGEQIAEFERDVFTRGLTPEQQEERLERASLAVANIRDQQETVRGAKNMFFAGREMIEAEQKEIQEAVHNFLPTNELADFVFGTINNRIPGALNLTAHTGVYYVNNSKELQALSRELMRAYPVSHRSRGEIARFAHLVQNDRLKVSFIEQHGSAQFAHVRHPLVILSRWLARERAIGLPITISPAENEGTDYMLVWAVGTLEGYTNKVQIYCCRVDGLTAKASMRDPAEAQEELLAIPDAPETADTPEAHMMRLLAAAEAHMARQLADDANEFRQRDSALSDRAKEALRSHASKKMDWLDKQLARQDIGNKIKNLYRGWRERIATETERKLDEIETRSMPKSALQVIGALYRI